MNHHRTMTTSSLLLQLKSYKVRHIFEKKQGGSVPGRIYKYRNREERHARLYQDYLAENPTYGPTDFRRRLILFDCSS
jgi:hypothetical protein